MSKASNPVAIEAKLQQLRELVAWFESEEFVIDEALERFATAQKLAEEVEKELQEVKNKVTVLKEKFDQ